MKMDEEGLKVMITEEVMAKIIACLGLQSQGIIVHTAVCKMEIGGRSGCMESR